MLSDWLFSQTEKGSLGMAVVRLFLKGDQPEWKHYLYLQRGPKTPHKLTKAIESNTQNRKKSGSHVMKLKTKHIRHKKVQVKSSS